MTNNKQSDASSCEISPEVRETLLDFPTRFPVKVIGKNSADFQALIEQIAQQHIPQSDLLNITAQTSSNDRFVSITIEAIFHNQAAIDALYQTLSAEPAVMMAL